MRGDGSAAGQYHDYRIIRTWSLKRTFIIFFSNFLLIFFKFSYLEDAQSFSVSNSFSRFAVDGQYAITFLYSAITVGQCARNDFVHLKEVELFLP